MGIPHVKSSCQEKNFQKKLLPCHKSISPVLNLECLLCSVSIAGKWGMSASLMSHLTCDSHSMKVSGYAFLLLVRGNFMEQVSYYRHFWRSPQLPSQLGEGHLSHRSQMLSDEYVNEWMGTCDIYKSKKKKPKKTQPHHSFNIFLSHCTY